MPTYYKKCKAMRKKIKRAKRCFYCDVKLTDENRTIDHKVPLGRGGYSNQRNLVMACRGCNEEKGNRTAVEYLKGKAVSCG